jgi:outer membrane biosynthesis protein TonB
MKRNLSVTTAAAALLIGTVFAAAQGVQRPGGGAEPGIQGGGQGQGGTQMAPSDGKGKAQTKEPRTQGQGGQGPREGQTQREGQRDAEPKTGQQPKQQQGQQKEGQQPKQQQGQQKEIQQPKQQQGQQKETQQPKQQQGQQREGEGKSKAAEGKGGASGSVNLTTEQRTHIRQTVIQSGNAPRVTNVNFSVSVGTVVPRDRVRLVTVPATIVEIHPAWRGYLYFIVDERIIIVEPDSHKIVAVLVV